MSTTRVLPIHEQDKAEVAQFLHENLNRRISIERWSSAMSHDWGRWREDLGLKLMSGDRLVGVLCVIYSEQTINGHKEKFCNPHSWCVLEEFRTQGIGLVLSILKLRDCHFTMFTPNPKVTQIFLGLGFKTLDERLIYFPNVPVPWPRAAGTFVVSDAESITARISGDTLADFNAHRDIPWLRFVAFGTGKDSCLVIYKAGRWKRMPCAKLVHISNPRVLASHGRLLRGYLLKAGFITSRVEGRFLEERPALSFEIHRTQPKLVRTKQLSDSQVRDLYSELMALDV